MCIDYTNPVIGNLVPAKILLVMDCFNKTIRYLWVNGNVSQLFSGFWAITVSVLSILLQENINFIVCHRIMPETCSTVFFSAHQTIRV